MDDTYTTTAPVDWDGPWGGRVHVATGGGVDAEGMCDQ